MRSILAIVLTMQVALATANVSRETLIAQAVDFYRTGAWTDAAGTFARLGSFAKGEEHLRYYNAVALFEIGRYDAAQQELACALPFVEPTEDVDRYRAKIEGMAAVAE